MIATGEVEDAERPTFVFDTTTAALWAEEVVLARGIPAELVPAPAGSRAKCDLALVTLPERVDAVVTALEDEGVPFRVWPDGAVAGA